MMQCYAPAEVAANVDLLSRSFLHSSPRLIHLHLDVFGTLCNFLFTYLLAGRTVAVFCWHCFVAVCVFLDLKSKFKVHLCKGPNHKKATAAPDNLLPRDAMLARYMLSLCIYPSVCLSVRPSAISWYCIEITGRIELIWAWRLPSTYPTMRFKEIWVYPKTGNLENFATASRSRCQ